MDPRVGDIPVLGEPAREVGVVENLLPVVKRIVLDQGISPAIPAEFIIWVIEPKSCSICLIGFYTAS